MDPYYQDLTRLRAEYVGKPIQAVGDAAAMVRQIIPLLTRMNYVHGLKLTSWKPHIGDYKLPEGNLCLETHWTYGAARYQIMFWLETGYFTLTDDAEFPFEESVDIKAKTDLQNIWFDVFSQNKTRPPKKNIITVEALTETYQEISENLRLPLYTVKV